MAASSFCIPSLTQAGWAVEIWKKGMVLEHRSQAQVGQFKIKEIIWAKERDVIGHEYLVGKVQIADPAEPEIALLRIERRTSKEIIEAIISSPDVADALFGEDLANIAADREVLNVQLQQELKAKAKGTVTDKKDLCFVSISDSSCNYRAVALDTVTRIPTSHWYSPSLSSSSNDTKLFTYTFRSNGPPFTLRDLGIILDAVHTSEKECDWKTRNCFWFARIVMKVIEATVVPNPIVKAHPDRNWVGRAGFRGASFLPGSLAKFSPDDVNTLVATVKDNIADDDARILKIWEEGQGELNRQTERANQQTARADQQSARADQQTARAELAEERSARLQRENEELHQMVAELQRAHGFASTTIVPPVSAS